MRSERLARFISPTLGAAYVDIAIGVGLIFAVGIEQANPSRFYDVTGGRLQGAALFLTVGIFTTVGVILAGRTRRAALLANVALWAFVAATVVQTGGYFGFVLTSGYAVFCALRYVQVKGLDREHDPR